MSTLPQEFLGRFQLLAQLGSGGMGTVYKARDLKLKRVVALKIMHPSLSHNQEFRTRFLQEAQTGARLKHPGIVQVYDVIEEDDYLIIVGDFIEGENLVSRMRTLRAENCTMPVEEAIELVRQVSLALAYVHQNGVLHCDIKPDNILLEPVPGERLPYRPVLVDLELAKLLVGGIETQAGISVGTPAYMAPEQVLGQPMDARSDVYALGVLLYELVTGRLPFPLRTVSEAIRCHMYEPPPVPPPLPAGFPTELSLLLKETLQRDREARPANAETFAVLLGSLLETDEERDARAARLLQAALSRGIKTETIKHLLPDFNIPVEMVKSGALPLSITGSRSLAAELIEPLSEREFQVLRLLDSALTSVAIGRQLYISSNTVRTHIRNIYSKLDVHGRIEAVQKARDLNLI